MERRVKKVFFILGGISLGLTLMITLYSAALINRIPYRIVFTFLSISIILLICGVVDVYQTQIYNENLIDTEGALLSGTCFRCHNSFTVDRRYFRPGRRYPEGYIYCSCCKQPLSINLFHPNVPSSDSFSDDSDQF